MNLISSIIIGRCPHCRKGKIFNGVWTMNVHCPTCKIKFEREDGYFMMAVFIGYILLGAVIAPMAFALFWYDLPLIWYSSLAITAVLLAPFVFRYSRIIWLYIDELLDPHVAENQQAPNDK